MLGNAKPYFTLIAQSPNRDEVERAATDYKKAHPGTNVIIDHWKDHLQQTKNTGIWRARVKAAGQKSAVEWRFFHKSGT